MTGSLKWPLTALVCGILGYVGAPVVAALLGVATWTGEYDDSALASGFFWVQMVSFGVAVVGLLWTLARMVTWRRRARP
jgi:membrane protein implicated in regulation of membrane protease activity